jgi:hypothetical protein
MVNQLLARPRPLAGDMVLAGLLELTRMDPTAEKLPDVMPIDMLRLLGRTEGIATDQRQTYAAEIMRRTADPEATRRDVAEAARLDLRLVPFVDDSDRYDC